LKVSLLILHVTWMFWIHLQGKPLPTAYRILALLDAFLTGVPSAQLHYNNIPSWPLIQYITLILHLAYTSL
jgi:hypothetical protein